MQTDVLIVGAGPTGLALACQMIRFGIHFRIIDKKEGTTPYSKAIGVHARTLEIYEQIGLADKLIALGTIAEKTKLFAGGKVRGEAVFSELGKGLSPYPFILLVEQGQHERLLYDYILSHGKDVEWETELEGFSQNDDEVISRLRDASGAVCEVRSKFLIGCDGAKSKVRHDLDLEFSGSTFERMFYVADVAIDWEYGHDALQIFLMRNSLLAFFPMVGEKRYRIVGTFPREFERDEGDILYEEIEERIKLDAEIDLDITNVNWFSTYKVHTRHVKRFSVGRCFLAGDSAHIHSPAGAQGMNTGIQDGYDLAWKLAFVLRGAAKLELLETYNEERLPNARMLTQTTDRFFGLAAGPNPITALLRIFVFPYIANLAFRIDAIKRFVFRRVSQIGINYRGLSLSKGRGDLKVKAGDRMPWFEVDGASIYDRIRKPRFHLIVFCNDPAAAFGEDVLGSLGAIVDTTAVQITTQISRIFGTDNPFLVLLRPDNYIGLTSHEVSPEIVEDYMRSFISG